LDCCLLTGDRLDLTDYRFGTPQQAGSLTVLPITSHRASDAFLPFSPDMAAEEGAKTDSVVLTKASGHGCFLAPLHFDGPGNLFLPLSLRGPAWTSRRSTDPARLTPAWNDLHGRLRRLGRPLSLHSCRPELDLLTRRIELLTGQLGALFFLNDRPVGLEIAPSPAYFAAVWQPMLMGCYGMVALLSELESPGMTSLVEPYAVSRIADLRTEMFRVRHQRQEQLEASVTSPQQGEFTTEEEQRWRNYRVQSLTGPRFAGQYVEEVTTIEAKSAESGAMPKMLRNLFRKGSLPNGAASRHRIHYVSLFAL
jgi:hypothetical protein